MMENHTSSRTLKTDKDVTDSILCITAFIKFVLQMSPSGISGKNGK